MTLTASRAETTAPPATRARRRGWRNPRLLVGVVLVAASVLLGARLMAGADETVPVWTVARDLPAGATLTADDVERSRVRFPDAALADRYLPGDRALPRGATLGRSLGAGELLPRAALARDTGPTLVEVPLSVAADDLPSTVRQGSVVDVWVTPEVAAADDQAPQAAKVLDDVVVVAVPRRADTLAPQATRQVIVGVPADRADDLAAGLGALADGRAVVARVG